MRTLLVLATSTWLLVVAAEFGLLWTENATPHHPHAHASSMAVDHDHIGVHRIAPAPSDFTAAAVPRWTNSLAASGVAAALVVVAASLVRLVAPSTRGPPSTSPPALAGQSLLQTLCIARR